VGQGGVSDFNLLGSFALTEKKEQEGRRRLPKERKKRKKERIGGGVGYRRKEDVHASE